MPLPGTLPAGFARCYSGCRKVRKVEVLSADIAVDPASVRPRRLPQRWGVFVIAGAIAAINLIPLGFIIWVAVAAGWDQVAALVLRPRVGELLINTIWLELLTLPVAATLAFSPPQSCPSCAVSWPPNDGQSRTTLIPKKCSSSSTHGMLRRSPG